MLKYFCYNHQNLKGNILKKYLFLLATILFAGCMANIAPQSSKSYQITIVSAMIKINDVGFLHEYKNSINLQIYSSGINSANIKVSDKICVNRVCFSKKEFNEKFFKNGHYDEIFADIITKKPIYEGQNFKKTECGFSQILDNGSLKYEICSNETKFQDTKNNVKIIIRELK